MTKTTLTLDVEYDDQVTDPEALATAADTLLKTVLSTPGIVEEYGDPKFGEFFVVREMIADSAQPLVLEESVKSDTKQEPYLWLGEYEEDASDDGGNVRLVDGIDETPGAAVFVSPLFRAAPAMRTALHAIVARIKGAFDDPKLVSFGTMTLSPEADCAVIAEKGLMEIDAERPPPARRQGTDVPRISVSTTSRESDAEKQGNLHDYALRIEGPLLARQRELLLKVSDTVFRGQPYVAETPKDDELLQGVVALLDEIADQAHDRHGLDSLIRPEKPCPHNQYVCECEQPGHFCSGVPGILAHLDNGRLPKGEKVERCDLCRRYESDAAALDKLRELGIASP